MKIWLFPIHIMTSETLRKTKQKIKTECDIKEHKLKIKLATAGNLIDGMREAERTKNRMNEKKWHEDHKKKKGARK